MPHRSTKMVPKDSNTPLPLKAQGQSRNVDKKSKQAIRSGSMVFRARRAEARQNRLTVAKKIILGDQPFKVRAGVSQVIRGWDLALIDMKEGESRKLVVPPELGYGDKGVGPIPGKATLYFEMTLTKVGPIEELTPEAMKWLEEHPL
mmetsp:Transcript_12012/g.34424  ORF Transcript_12012/g.34424 Transcript_12012/m.34424 type:complete len:147 (+) Transcript_12012:537-977(+)